MSQTVCLSMIIKDESNEIISVLDGIIPIIDTYCIFNDKSSDNTIKIISEYFIKKNIQGKIQDMPILDPTIHVKTALFEESKKMANYVVILDPDSIVKISATMNKKKLSCDFYLFKQVTGNVINYKCCMIKSTMKAICSGSVYQHWDVKSLNYKCLWYVEITNSSEKNINNKDKITILFQEIIKDPTNYTSLFHLAEVYYLTGDYAASIYYFKKRFGMKRGTYEDNWFCCYRIGLCYLIRQEWENGVAWMLEGYQCYPYRSENIYEIMKYYCGTCQYKLAEIFYNLGKQIRYPSKSTLQIRGDVYDYLFDVDYVIFKYYLVSIRDLDFNITMNKIIQQALNKCNNDKFFNNFLNNIWYYHVTLPQIGEIIGFDKKEEIKDQWNNLLYQSTPSIIRYKTSNDDCYFLNQRYINYTIDLEKRIHIFKDHNITTNKIIKYDTNFNIISEIIIDPIKIPNCETYNVLEDLKLFQHNGEIYVIGTSTYSKMSKINRELFITDTSNVNHRAEINIFFGKYDTKLNKFEYKTISSPYFHFIERNWVLFENNKKELKVVYDWFPLEIGTIKDFKYTKDSITDTPLFFKYVHGSSPGCTDPLNPNHTWFVVHFRTREMDTMWYLTSYIHVLVVLDNTNYSIVKYSIPFKFKGNLIEFCLGLIVEKDSLIISYSTDDNTSNVVKYDRKVVENKFF